MAFNEKYTTYYVPATRTQTRRERYGHRRRSYQSGPWWWTRFFGTRRRAIASLVVIVVVPLIFVQLFWSTTALLPNTYVGSVNVSAMSKAAAAAKLDKAYAETKVPVYFTDSNEVVVEPTLANLGFTITNSQRVDAYSYPFVARLIPFTLFFYQTFMAKGEPQVARSDDAFSSYITGKFGPDCDFAPVDATIAYVDDDLQVVDASRGGSCDINELTQKLQAVSGRLNPDKITVNGTSTAPTITTEVAQKEYNRLMSGLNNGLELKVQDHTDHIDKSIVEPWIVYTAANGGLTLGVQADKVTAWLNDTYGKQFIYDAGVTTVTLKDYTESSRDTGKSGSSLNTGETVAAITKELQDDTAVAVLAITTIQPTVQYQSTYSAPDPTISAIMKQYAQSHPGTYGVKMVELSGARRNASYNSSAIFTTASTYKLFVAYSILLRIERGDVKWSHSSADGYNLSACFDRMIEYSDNDCALSLLSIAGGYSAVQADARALGESHTTFSMKNGITSNANDEADFLSLLYTGQILSQQSSRDKLITAMKGNVYVAGIPTGIPNATVADKVGFLDDLLHDAAIVYSKKGDYVLIIMTNEASWANIAELAGKIEAAR